MLRLLAEARLVLHLGNNLNYTGNLKHQYYYYLTNNSTSQ